ncbi:MAG: rhomboid family intramembrane serine protease [Caldisericaceae bacterium]
MIPLKDTQETKTFPFLTILIILLNVLVYIWMDMIIGSAPDQAAAQASLYFRYGIVPFEITTGKQISGYPSISPLWLSIFTSMFVHGGFMHIAGNMLYFWIFGNNIEDYLGHFKFLLFYLASGVAAAAVQIFTSPNSTVPVIGASGAIAGIMGAYFFLYPRARIKTLVFVLFFFTFIQIPAYIFLLIWFLMQLSSGFSTFGSASGVAFWAHVGGFIFGFIVAVLTKSLRHEPEEYWN